MRFMVLVVCSTLALPAYAEPARPPDVLPATKLPPQVADPQEVQDAPLPTSPRPPGIDHVASPPPPPPPGPNPFEASYQQEIMECFLGKVQLRAQLLNLSAPRAAPGPTAPAEPPK